VCFNPLTPANVAKALLRIAAAEGVSLSGEAATALATAGGCDLRNAINNLQLMFAPQHNVVQEGVLARKVSLCHTCVMMSDDDPTPVHPCCKHKRDVWRCK
jgi:DNA polymerase III delta prime subunit